MVLYTPLAQEDIFPGNMEHHQMVTYKGRSVFAERVGDEWKLVQLISSNPEDFLLEEFTPGAILPNEIVHMDK